MRVLIMPISCKILLTETLETPKGCGAQGTPAPSHALLRAGEHAHFSHATNCLVHLVVVVLLALTHNASNHGHKNLSFQSDTSPFPPT